MMDSIILIDKNLLFVVFKFKKCVLECQEYFAVRFSLTHETVFFIFHPAKSKFLSIIISEKELSSAKSIKEWT